MSPRAAKVCSEVRCPNIAPCPDHPTGPWASSKRHTQTISGRARQKRNARIMRQYERTCHVCGQPMADTIDHVVPLAEGGTDTPDNLRPIHGPSTGLTCHTDKTAAEAKRGRERAS